MATLVTETDPSAGTSLVEDTLVRLREWGSHNHKKIEGRTDYTIGASSRCWWTLAEKDGKRHLSRVHAQLLFDGARWVLHDLSQKNGIFVGDTKYTQVVLEPGRVFRLGSLTIVAEGAREVTLRGFLLRILGYKQLLAVDLALQTLRGVLDNQQPLTLAGTGNLVSIAHAIHRRLLGPDRPFIVSTPERGETEESVRVARNFQRGMDALAAAVTGTLCVVEDQLPDDYDEVLAALADPAMRVHLFTCKRKVKRNERALVIPPIAQRSGDLDLIAYEYGLEAMAAMGLDGPLKIDDRAWVLANCADSLADIEKGAHRIAALRKHRGTSSAATTLGMSRVALGKWLTKRSPLPFRIGT